jgi:Ran GTPase-activating protein (RanGAP) involved in mRNA processing and transport
MEMWPDWPTEPPFQVFEGRYLDGLLRRFTHPFPPRYVVVTPNPEGDNSFPGERWQQFVTILGANTTLTTIIFKGLDQLGPGGPAIGRMLARNRSITSVDVVSCGDFGEAAGYEMAAALRVNTTLLRLRIESCPIGRADEFLGDSLTVNSTLLCLDLHQSQMTRRGAAWIGAGLAANSALTTLDLGECPVSKSGAKQIGAALAVNSTLRFLYLPMCRICDSSSARIARGLATNSALVELDLDLATIEDRASEALGNSLAVNSTLTKLTLACCSTRDAAPLAAERIARALCVNSALRYLDLESWKVGDQGAAAFGQTLACNSTLTDLNFSMGIPAPSGVGVFGSQRLAEGLARNTTLSSLKMDLWLLEKEVQMQFLTVLATHPALTDLLISPWLPAERYQKQLIRRLKLNQHNQQRRQCRLFDLLFRRCRISQLKLTSPPSKPASKRQRQQ